MFNLSPQGILISAIGIVLAVTLHEYVKCMVAYKLGDTGIKTQGRHVPNLFKSVDILGGIFMLLFGYGWSNPARINAFSFTNRKKAAILLFTIPFLANFIAGVSFAIVFNAMPNIAHALNLSFNTFSIITQVLRVAATFNITFALFSIIPIYPLNGINLLAGIKPMWAAKISRYEKILQIVLAFMIILGVVAMIFNPIAATVFRAIAWGAFN